MVSYFQLQYTKPQLASCHSAQFCSAQAISDLVLSTCSPILLPDRPMAQISTSSLLNNSMRLISVEPNCHHVYRQICGRITCDKMFENSWSSMDPTDQRRHTWAFTWTATVTCLFAHLTARQLVLGCTETNLQHSTLSANIRSVSFSYVIHSDKGWLL